MTIPQSSRKTILNTPLYLEIGEDRDGRFRRHGRSKKKTLLLKSIPLSCCSLRSRNNRTGTLNRKSGFHG
jgi:hypothetical protein